MNAKFIKWKQLFSINGNIADQDIVSGKDWEHREATFKKDEGSDDKNFESQGFRIGAVATFSSFFQVQV